MLELLKDLLLVSLGGGIGVMLMCLLIAGKQADREMEQLVFKQCTEPCFNGNRGYRRVSGLQA